MTRSGYYVEGWDGLTAIGSRFVARPATAIREAQHLALDLGATIVWVRRDDGTAVYTMDAGLFWKRHAGDERLAAAIEEMES